MTLFIIERKSLTETDIIIDVLKSENIPYKLRPIKMDVTPWSEGKTIGYDIEVFTDLEHFDFANKLIEEKTNQIIYLEKLLNKPVESIEDEQIHVVTLGHIEVREYKPKKSLLKRLIDWIMNEKTDKSSANK